MTVIGIVGPPGSGKSEAAAVARDLGVPVVTMGDVIREACRSRGVDPAMSHGEVASALRKEGGQAAIADRSLPMINDRLEDHDVVVVDGIRSDAEVELFETEFGDRFVLVCVEAPFEVRAERIRERGRDDVGEAGESLRDRDARERGFGMAAAMDRADIVIENTGSLREFHQRIHDVLTSER